MREKYDIRQMKKEIAEDETISKSKPVLLSQREIHEMIKNRGSKTAEGERHDHV